MTHNQHLDAIEAICDDVGPKQLAMLVAEVFSTKAYPIQEAWQGSALADEWDECAALLLIAADKIPTDI